MTHDQPGRTTYDGVHFKANNGKYVSAFLWFYYDVLNADASEAKEWETFALTPLGVGPLKSGDVVNLRASNGMYVHAKGGGGGELIANSNMASHYEAFTILRADKSDDKIKNGDKVVLRAYNGQYLSVRDGNKLIANQNQIGPLETFTIEMITE